LKLKRKSEVGSWKPKLKRKLKLEVEEKGWAVVE
jgi:hypothetical protein